MSVLQSFHPAVAAWFTRTFDAPTPAQVAGVAGDPVRDSTSWWRLPRGPAKPSRRFSRRSISSSRKGVAGALPDETRVVYVSPLKALSNDIHRNLEAPLQGIREELAALNLPDVAIRTVVRTGDTAQSERARMRRTAPHIVVTTPESLYILLTSQIGPGHALDLPHRDRR